ncbi:MAG: hypothetical protein R3B91_19330, partial [Planctomycetaceae bacterium]
MIRIYAVRRMNVNHSTSKRVSQYHSRVFHGLSHYVNRGVVPRWQWRSPAKTNTNRELVHVSRSGALVPDVFGARIFELIVSERVRKRLQNVPEIEFNPVVFERLVDVPMPPLGDFTWCELEPDGNSPDDPESKLNPDYEFTHLPDIEEYHQTIGPYYSLLAPNIHDIIDEYNDTEEVMLHWGEYHKVGVGKSSKPVSLSLKLLKQCPIIRSDAHIFRDDVFGLIAPFLDLDYYAVTMAHLGPREPHGNR